MVETPKQILDIKTADLKASAPTFQEQSAALQLAAKTLAEKLGELGTPWGDDEQGSQFADTYLPHVKQIKQSTGILIDGLASIHLAMTDMADGHIENEALIAAMFARVKADGGAHDGSAK
ncbi:hypothetical protein [Streptomyces peucetius]|uniref:WXG100 family type VII secretion target n=1 Tax=Streptomyces peucetius TaxID=1950 RepID=A0ABY6I6R8_STRPE|nr:hypothetical protein [Streptomyces peucetius]UYQ62618.1 hypothetical protein OGH68_14760 [Streptomyces peucetius]